MKKIYFMLFLLANIFILKAQDMHIVPSFTFYSGYDYYRYNDNSIVYNSLTDKQENSFYAKIDGSLQIVVPKTIFSFAYSVNSNVNEPVAFDLEKYWAKFYINDYVKLQIGRYCMNLSEGLVWNVSDIINNKQKWNSTAGIAGKDGMDINICIPLNVCPINLDAGMLFFRDISDMALFILIGTMINPFDIKLKCAYYNETCPAVGLTVHTNYKRIGLCVDSIFLADQSIKENYGFSDNKFQFRFTGNISYYQHN